MNLLQLKSIFAAKGCKKIYVKILSANDNSKNQVYLGGSFEVLNIFPISQVTTEPEGQWEKERFKAVLNFAWIDEEGNVFPAPLAQFILYPKYPEVRFSGFLLKCEKPPSGLMSQRLPGRILFMSVSQLGQIIGYVESPGSEIAWDFLKAGITEELGVFKIIELENQAHNKIKLLAELRRIHLLNWINSKRLDKDGKVIACKSSNCGGYTLEAELGITPNGFSEPDFLGWELKQFGVDNFTNLNNAVITLMTPEPTHGFYVTGGAEAFIHKYGYDDKKGRPDRKNFGGIHKCGERQKSTGLMLSLEGFDSESGKIRSTNGKIALIDLEDNVAASWSFSSLLLHWNRKHDQACYVPSISEKLPERKYKYGGSIILGVGTDFQLFLKEMAVGNVYYDPGIKMENFSSKPEIKKRSQFRIRSSNLKCLYRGFSVESLLDSI